MKGGQSIVCQRTVVCVRLLGVPLSGTAELCSLLQVWGYLEARRKACDHIRPCRL